MKIKILFILPLAMVVIACAPAPTATPMPPVPTAPVVSIATATQLPPTSTIVPPTFTLAPPTLTPLLTSSPTLTLSEKSDDATFRANFNELFLTNLAEISTFKLGEKICPIAEFKSDMRGSIALYDAAKKTDTARSVNLPAGSYQFCDLFGWPLALPAGAYEFKFRLGDKLAAVLPFQIQASNSPLAPAPLLSEQPDSQAFNTLFNAVFISNMPPTTVFKSSERLATFVDSKKEVRTFEFGLYDAIKQTYIVPKSAAAQLLAQKVTLYFRAPVRIPFPLPAGRYEFKYWVGDALAAVLPFQVQ